MMGPLWAQKHLKHNGPAIMTQITNTILAEQVCRDTAGPSDSLEVPRHHCVCRTLSPHFSKFSAKLNNYWALHGWGHKWPCVIWLQQSPWLPWPWSRAGHRGCPQMWPSYLGEWILSLSKQVVGGQHSENQEWKGEQRCTKEGVMAVVR